MIKYYIAKEKRYLIPGKEMRTMFTAHIASYQKEERNQKAMLERKCEHSLFSVFFNRIGNMGEGTWHRIEMSEEAVTEMSRLEPGQHILYGSFRTLALVKAVDRRIFMYC